jgi:hypothetical protein
MEAKSAKYARETAKLIVEIYGGRSSVSLDVETLESLLSNAYNVGRCDALDRENTGTARALIAEMEQPAPAKHGYGCACHDCGMEREDRKAAATKQPASILDQWEPAPEWAKAAKRVDAQSVNNTTRTGPDGCLPALS